MLPRLAIPVLFVLLLSIVFVPHVYAQQTLENPQPGSFQSGVGVISGWACEAQTIEVSFDGGPRLQAGAGTIRADTHGVCGDTDNGFGLLYNWNLLGDGVHTVTAYADGVEFASVKVTVTTLGTEFLRGASGAFTVSDFPATGATRTLRWQQAQQNFVITAGNPQRGGTSGAAPHILENPQPGSFQSGVGVISGWACNAQTIEISFDGGSRLQAGAGTLRADTQGVCGDTDNGFGLLYNWNLLGDGPHTVTAYADGIEFARVTVTVTTLGEEFRRGLSREVTIPDFPEDGTDVVLQWQEAQQNFVITQLNADITRGPAEKMYWLDPSLQRVQRANLDGSQIETVYTHPRSTSGRKDFAVDPRGGKIYWKEDGRNERIYRANLDGTEIEAIVDRGYVGGASVASMRVDQGARKIVYITLGDDWWRANLDGTQQEFLRRGRVPGYGYWAVEDGTLYYYAYNRTDDAWFLVGQALADPSAPQIRIDPDAVHGPGSISVDAASGKIYWWTAGARLQRANLDGTHIESLPVPIPDARTAWAVEGDNIYWVEEGTGSLYRDTIDPRARNLVTRDLPLHRDSLCTTCALPDMLIIGRTTISHNFIYRYDFSEARFRDIIHAYTSAIKDFVIDEVAGKLHILIESLEDYQGGIADLVTIDLATDRLDRLRIHENDLSPRVNPDYERGDDYTQIASPHGGLVLDQRSGTLYWMVDKEFYRNWPINLGEVDVTAQLYRLQAGARQPELVWESATRKYGTTRYGTYFQCAGRHMVRHHDRDSVQIIELTDRTGTWMEVLIDPNVPPITVESSSSIRRINLTCIVEQGDSQITVFWIGDNTLNQGRLGALAATRVPKYIREKVRGILGHDRDTGELLLLWANPDSSSTRDEVLRWNPQTEDSKPVLSSYGIHHKRIPEDTLDEWQQDPQTWQLPGSVRQFELATQ